MTAFNEGRYPYTYSADLMREWSETNELSRAGAASLRNRLAELLGETQEAFAERLADQYLERYGITKGPKA